MEIIDAIKSRRSIGKVSEQEPDRKLIETILESAQWAPNHFRTEPYSFIVLSGKGRERLGDAYGRINIEQMDDSATKEEKEAAYEKGLGKAMRSPVVIIVVVEPSTLAKVVFSEEIAATASAVQNMLLTAHGLGLGTMWRTGAPSYHSIMKETFGVSEQGLVLGYVYVGYPAIDPPKPPKKRALNEMVKWIDQ